MELRMVMRQRGVISMPPSLPNSSGQSIQRLLCVDSFNRHAVGQIAKVPLTMDCCFLRAKRSLALQPPVARRPPVVQKPVVAQRPLVVQKPAVARQPLAVQQPPAAQQVLEVQNWP